MTDIQRRATPGDLATQPRKTILLDDVEILFTNFTGEGGPYNTAGKRNFMMKLPYDAVQQFMDDGYNVKPLKSRDPDEPPAHMVKVNVNYESRNPPEINLVNSLGRRIMSPETVQIMDWARFSRVDVVVTRYERSGWADGRTTITLYLQTMYAFLEEDALRERYGHIPQIDVDGTEIPLDSAQENGDIFIVHENQIEDEKQRALAAEYDN